MEKCEKWIKEIDGELCISTEGLSQIMNVTKRAIALWEKDGCPKVCRGWWSLKKVIEWRGLGGTTGGSGKEKSWRQRKLEAEVELKEAQGELTKVKNSIARGDYLDREYVESELKRFHMVLKRSITSIPRRVAGVIARYVDTTESRRVEAELTEMLNNALEQMSVDGVYNGKK